MKLFAFIVYMITFTQLSYAAFFELCLISLFCTSAYSYDLTHSTKDTSKSDPIITVFYITKYLLHFIYHYLRKQKHSLMELENCEEPLKPWQTKSIQVFKWYDSADIFCTDIIVYQSVSFIQTNFIRLFMSVVNQIVTKLCGDTLPNNFNKWQTETQDNLKKEIDEVDAKLDAELESDCEDEPKKII